MNVTIKYAVFLSGLMVAGAFALSYGHCLLSGTAAGGCRGLSNATDVEFASFSTLNTTPTKFPAIGDNAFASEPAVSASKAHSKNIPTLATPHQAAAATPTIQTSPPSLSPKAPTAKPAPIAPSIQEKTVSPPTRASSTSPMQTQPPDMFDLPVESAQPSYLVGVYR